MVQVTFTNKIIVYIKGQNGVKIKGQNLGTNKGSGYRVKIRVSVSWTILQLLEFEIIPGSFLLNFCNFRSLNFCCKSFYFLFLCEFFNSSFYISRSSQP